MPSSVSVYDALGVIADFDEELATGDETKTPEQRRKLFTQHLQKMDKLNFTLPQFKQGLDWLNVSKPLTWDNTLKGQLVVLDFFTYCCVNCMHILPDLKVLDETHPTDSGLVVVGVHSAKFDNEKVTANILSAVLRHDITHPVVNDSDATLWQDLSIACWPTLVFVGPSNQLLYTLVGEGHLNQMLEFVDIAKGHYSSTGQLLPKSLPVHLEWEKVTKSVLSFPGKVFCWADRDWLVISDTGNHRIVITDRQGVVQETIGSGSPGFQDGTFLDSKFSFPQGIVCLRDKIYVADTGNHAVRVIDLTSGMVSTIAGTGKQGMDKEGGQMSTLQEIASPWDLVLGHSQNKCGETDPDVLFIAMAGTHQIWVYFLEDADWYKGRSYSKGTCVRFAGSGAEENRNNSYPEKAGFAQPSGLALSKTRKMIYIADSESSSIRSLSLKDGKVTAVAGAEKDPMNLFASGDVDGKGVKAKLQHPLGVSLVSPDGPLIVADSYNHKLKTIDLDSFECQTLSLSSQTMSDQPSSDGLNEPGGVDVHQDSGTIYIADTNNHLIKVVEFESKTLRQLPILFPNKEMEDTTDSRRQDDNLCQDLTSLPAVTISLSDTSVRLSVPFGIGEGEHLNTEAPNGYRISSLDESSSEISKLISSFNCKGKLTEVTHGRTHLTIPLTTDRSSGSYALHIVIQIYPCLDEGDVCLPPRKSNFKQIIRVK